MAGRPVHWFALGGTMQTAGHDALDTDRYWQTGVSVAPDDLIDPIRALVGPVIAEAVDARPSHDLDPEALLALAERLRRLDADQVAGAVVSCGSNGLEEIAFLMWLLGAPVPVALTAAMRPPTAIGTDALSNLADAVSVARAEATRDHGVVIVSDGVVLHPAEAIKSHSSRVDSFRISAMPLGTLVAGLPRYDRVPRPGPLSGLPVPASLAPVELVTSYLGSDGSAVRAAVERGVRGIVSAGTGAGFPTAAERRCLEMAVDAGVFVCQAQRTPFGATISETAPFLSARTLSPQKARLVLAAALGSGATLDAHELQGLLDRAAGQ